MFPPKTNMPRFKHRKETEKIISSEFRASDLNNNNNNNNNVNN
jgi:hypothetical protein